MIQKHPPTRIHVVIPVLTLEASMEKQQRLSLTLKKETLVKISTGDQSHVAGGAYSYPRQACRTYTHNRLCPHHK